MSLVSKEAVLAALEAFLHTPPKDGWSRDTLDKLDAMAEYSNGTVKRAMAAVRSLPAHQWTDGEIEAAARALVETGYRGRIITSVLEEDSETARAILDAAMGGDSQGGR